MKIWPQLLLLPVWFVLTIAPAHSQEAQTPENQPPSEEVLPDLKPGIIPEIMPMPAPDEPAPDEPAPGEDDNEGTDATVTQNEPDYSRLSREAEKSARLDALFMRLKSADEEDGTLIAEEIWALWLESGSASVNLVLSRGIGFEKNGDLPKARRMYDHVTTLSPDYAEGWARSARLAYVENDYNRALVECIHTLVLEPREFYALWTMGNVLEKLGRNAQALDVYHEALELYPAHPAIKARVSELEGQLQGSVL